MRYQVLEDSQTK